MVHSSLIKITSQMVFILLVKKTTLVMLDMLKLTCPKWPRVFWPLSKFHFFYQNFWFEKLKILVVIIYS
jgi:hypothetical protein